MQSEHAPATGNGALVAAGTAPRGRARYDHAFIVTYGRSGSTLLQGLLNAIPGYRILGENYDLLRRMELVSKRLPRHGVKRGKEDAAKPPTTQVTHPFYGFETFTAEAYDAAFRAFFDHLLLRGAAEPGAVRCLGFKEIRYTMEDIGAKVEFLRAVFPDCAIIYNIRNPAEVVESAFQRGKEVEGFEQFNALLEERTRADPHSFLVRYEDVVKATGSLIGLHEFLGEPFDAVRTRAVLSVKHSQNKKAEDQVYSDVPMAVVMNKSLRGFRLFVADRYKSEDGVVRVGGLIVAKDGTEVPKFAKVLDPRGKAVKFRATFGLDSARLKTKFKSDAAAHARFTVAFTRASPEEHKVFFENGELAMTLRAETPPVTETAAPD